MIKYSKKDRAKEKTNMIDNALNFLSKSDAVFDSFKKRAELTRLFKSDKIRCGFQEVLRCYAHRIPTKCQNQAVIFVINGRRGFSEEFYIFNIFLS